MDIYTQLRTQLQAEYDKGATDQAIASRLGCSQQQINHLRNGKRSFAKMHLETLLKLFPSMTITLGGVPIHGGSVATVNGHGNIVAARVGNGNHIAIPVAPTAVLIDQIMLSDMCDGCKVKAYTIIKGKCEG